MNSIYYSTSMLMASVNYIPVEYLASVKLERGDVKT